MLDAINVKYFRFAVGSDIGKETPNDVSARCNICGDSEKDKKQKRLHLYRKPSYDQDRINCFNCGFHGNMYSYLKECNSILFEQYKKEKRESSFNDLKSKHHKEKETGQIIDIGYTYKKKAEVFTFKFPEQFIPISESEDGSAYIKGRRLSTEGIYFSQDGLKIGDKYLPIKDCVVIPLWYNEDERTVYGFQARSIKEKRFYTYIPEENSGYKVWNWYGIDKTKPVFIFESVFDALSAGLPKNRVVSALGSDLNNERLSELNEGIFCLDNQHKDNTSKVKSIKLLKDGYRVFVWPTDIEEKDPNSWLQNRSGEESFALVILNNLMTGNRGILKIKLG